MLMNIKKRHSRCFFMLPAFLNSILAKPDLAFNYVHNLQEKQASILTIHFSFNVFLPENPFAKKDNRILPPTG